MKLYLIDGTQYKDKVTVRRNGEHYVFWDYKYIFLNGVFLGSSIVEEQENGEFQIIIENGSFTVRRLLDFEDGVFHVEITIGSVKMSSSFLSFDNVANILGFFLTFLEAQGGVDVVLNRNRH